MPNIIAKECRFVVAIPPERGSVDDYHLVKEVLHYDDGTTAPNITYIKNYKRKFWVTKKAFRNHKRKKEGELLKKVTEYTTNSARLYQSLSKALDMPWHRKGIQDLYASPYVYGLDISTTALIKHDYFEKYPDVFTNYTSGVMDIETDVAKGTNEIIVTTFAYKNVITTSVKRSFVEGIVRPEEKIRLAIDKYLGEYVNARNLVFDIHIVDDSWQTSAICFEAAHKVKPDFISFWNMDFDMPRIKKSYEAAGLDIKDYVSDPSLPKDLRFYKYNEGSRKKITSSGKVQPKDAPSQWHTISCASSWYFIDAMCVYKQTRSPPKPEEPSYSLDYQLTQHLKRGKLKFKEADEYKDIDWHRFMQERYPIEYIVYNMFDCIGVQLLEEKTKDLAITLPTYMEHSDFAIFNSQPKRTCDQEYYHFLTQGMVFGTTGGQLKEELDEKILSLRRWIVALPAYSRSNNGLRNILEDRRMVTNIYVNSAD